MENQKVTPDVIKAHEDRLQQCMVEVDKAARSAEEAAKQAQKAAEVSRRVERETQELMERHK